MAISAADVMKLRQMTGAGMMDCKKALAESAGDMDQAVDILKKKGIAKAEKKADRASTEGTIAISLSEDKKSAAMVSLNCETDFVGRNQEFIDIAQNLADITLQNGVSTVDELTALQIADKTGKDIVTDAVMKLGENIQLGEVSLLKTDGFISSYVHMNGKIAVAVKMKGSFSDSADEAGKNLAMQVAAMNPVATRREGVPADLVAKEKEIYEEQIRQSGKPENLVEKIAEGKLNKYFSEVCLVEQSYVKEQKKTVKEYLADLSKENGVDIDVEDFVRLNIGA